MIYALIPLLKSDGHPLHTFDRGDNIAPHFTSEALAWFVEHDQASDDRPEDVTPAYSLIDGLTYHGAGAGLRFDRGDRIDGILPGPLVRDVITRGDASYDEPT